MEKQRGKAPQAASQTEQADPAARVFFRVGLANKLTKQKIKLERLGGDFIDLKAQM